MPEQEGTDRSIRRCLRTATSRDHAELDRQIGPLVGGNARDYATFLSIQYRARMGIEHWLERKSPDASPPPQAHLIANDLAALGAPVPGNTASFDLPADTPALGVCWVLAGSSLGNRAILARLAEIAVNRPAGFLSDTAMPAYWRSLLPRLEASMPESMKRPLVTGARATFAHFLAMAARGPAREAA